jgi:hypothetical protein
VSGSLPAGSGGFTAASAGLCGQSQLTLKNVSNGAIHHNSGSGALPFDNKPASGQLYFDPRIEQAPQTSCNNRRASASAASQGFTATTLKHSQANMVAIHNLHKPNIGFGRKAPMFL